VGLHEWWAVKEGSGNWSLSLDRGFIGEPGAEGCLRGILRKGKKRALELECVSVGALWGEPGGGAALTGALKDM